MYETLAIFRENSSTMRDPASRHSCARALVCVCVHESARVRVCVHTCTRACVCGRDDTEKAGEGGGRLGASSARRGGSYGGVAALPGCRVAGVPRRCTTEQSVEACPGREKSVDQPIR